MTGLTALEALKDSRRFRHEKEEHLVLIDINYFNRCLDVIEKELKRLERRDNINEQLYKDEECVLKKLKALEIIKELFDFDFALRFPTNQPILKITNKRTEEYWEIPISKEFELLKEVL